jgi:hypothetical protein
LGGGPPVGGGPSEPWPGGSPPGPGSPALAGSPIGGTSPDLSGLVPGLVSAGPVGALGTSIAGAAGADCSGSLPTAGEDPDSLELEDDPESLGPDDDGSNSVDPDDDPESGDAAAYPPPVPSPSRVASTPQAMARPASKRLVFTVGFPTSVRRSRREDPGAEQHESDEGRREVG